MQNNDVFCLFSFFFFRIAKANNCRNSKVYSGSWVLEAAWQISICMWLRFALLKWHWGAWQAPVHGISRSCTRLSSWAYTVIKKLLLSPRSCFCDSWWMILSFNHRKGGLRISVAGFISNPLKREDVLWEVNW